MEKRKTQVFEILKRKRTVYTVIINDAGSETLYPTIKSEVQSDSIVYTNCWHGYNILDVSKFKHYRINQSKLFVDKYNHINGIENFYGQSKRHMKKFMVPLRNIFIHP